MMKAILTLAAAAIFAGTGIAQTATETSESDGSKTLSAEASSALRVPVYRNVYDRCGRWIGRRLIGWNVAVYDYCGRLVGWRFVPCY